MPVDPIGRVERAQIERRDGVDHEPRQMPLRQPLAQARRQQQLLLAITRDEVLRHPGMVLTAPDGPDPLRNSLHAKQQSAANLIRYRKPGTGSDPPSCATAAFSLIVCGSSSASSGVGDAWCRSGLRWAHFSFGARVGAECSWELSRLLNSMQGRQAARKQRELAEAGSGRRGAAGLKGCWRERTCQAAIRILRATAALAGFLPARSARSV